MSAIEDNFRAALRSFGMDYAGPIRADGGLHRFKAEGDKARDSWYVLHAGTPAAGAFGCWKRGFKETWHESNGNLSQTEWDTIRRRWQEADRERKRTEAERQARARQTAAWIHNRAKPAQSHPYLERKGVRVFGDVREYRGALCLPLRDVAGVLHGLQLIGADGSKRFLSGGRVAGCFFALADNPDGPLVIAEGYATGASIAEATGLATVAAMNAGNVLAVARALRTKWPEREVIIAADNDQWTVGNPGLTKAREAALAIGARLAVPQFVDVSTRSTDFNDLAVLAGLAEVKQQVETSAAPKGTDEELFQRLAKLTPADYDRVREDEAKRAGVRVGTLDAEVSRHRPKHPSADTAQGSKVTFPEVEPWESPINGADLLNDIAAVLKRFVVAPEVAIIAASLFVLHTYAFDLGDISPILFITGPTKRCGKSKLLAILLRLVSRPFAAASATAAGIYRIIELHHPTLGIDEVDTFISGDEQLRGLINSGHTRDAAFHLGCAATADKDFEPRRWSTWTPKIFSGIGRLADTIEDRAIILTMARRRRDEPCERLRHGMRFDYIPRKGLRFVSDHTEALRDGNPSPPDALNDRAADNWTPLLILADLAGGDWPAKARQAALALSGGDDGEALGLNGQLLADIREVFAACGETKLASKDLAERLAQIEGRPWAEYGKQRRPISANQMANLLRGFGVSSRTIRIGDGTAKGYEAEGFSDAFSRYLPGNGLPGSNKVTLPADVEGKPVFPKVTGGTCDVTENAVSSSDDGGCYLVTVPTAETGVLEL